MALLVRAAFLNVLLVALTAYNPVLLVGAQDAVFKKGDVVTITTDFVGDTDFGVPLKAGGQGVITEVDEDGDLQVDFDKLDVEDRIQYVEKRNFEHLQKKGDDDDGQPGTVSEIFSMMKAAVAGISGLTGKATGSPLVFIGVMTAPGNVARRNEIRQTWFQHELLTMVDAPVQAKFIVGIPEPGSKAESDLADDMEMNTDIVQLSFQEGYHNLNRKSVSYFRWFADQQKAEFAMKLDDDTFPSLDRIVSILTTKVMNEKHFTYLGNMLVNRRPMDHGKWKQNPLVYSEEYYPKYAAGPGYIIRNDLVRIVFKENVETNIEQMLDNEDANTGLWISKAASSGVPVDYQHMEANEEKCMPKDTLAMNLDLGSMSCMWSRKVAGEADICCGHQKSDWQLRADLDDQASLLRRRVQQAKFLRGRHARRARPRTKQQQQQQQQQQQMPGATHQHDLEH